MDKISLKQRFNERHYEAIRGRVEKSLAVQCHSYRRQHSMVFVLGQQLSLPKQGCNTLQGCTCAAATPSQTHNWRTAVCLQHRRDKISKETAGLLVRRAGHQPTSSQSFGQSLTGTGYDWVKPNPEKCRGWPPCEEATTVMIYHQQCLVGNGRGWEKYRSTWFESPLTGLQG